MTATLENVRQNMTNTKHISGILQNARIERQQFNPTNAEHRAAYLIFMRTGKWVIHFFTDPAYTSITAMAQDRLLKHFLQNELTERTASKLMAQIDDKIVKVEPIKPEEIKVNRIPLLHKVA